MSSTTIRACLFLIVSAVFAQSDRSSYEISVGVPGFESFVRSGVTVGPQPVQAFFEEVGLEHLPVERE